jgi:hypothetical protein
MTKNIFNSILLALTIVTNVCSSTDGQNVYALSPEDLKKTLVSDVGGATQSQQDGQRAQPTPLTTSFSLVPKNILPNWEGCFYFKSELVITRTLQALCIYDCLTGTHYHSDKSITFTLNFALARQCTLSMHLTLQEFMARLKEAGYRISEK